MRQIEKKRAQKFKVSVDLIKGWSFLPWLCSIRGKVWITSLRNFFFWADFADQALWRGQKKSGGMAETPKKTKMNTIVQNSARILKSRTLNCRITVAPLLKMVSSITKLKCSKKRRKVIFNWLLEPILRGPRRTNWGRYFRFSGWSMRSSGLLIRAHGSAGNHYGGKAALQPILRDPLSVSRQ